MLYSISFHEGSKVITAPLSDTMTSGSPRTAKVVCSLSIVVAIVALVVT